MIKHKLRTTVKKINGDCLTPVLIFNRLQGTRKFLLESSAKHETNGRYSFIGVNPRKTYTGAHTTLTETAHQTGKSYSYEGDLVHLMKQVMPRVSNETEYPFTGGAIGYIRYNRSQSNIPAVNFHVYDTILIYDHVKDEVTIIHTNIDAEQSEPNLDHIIEQILNGATTQQGTYQIGEFKEQTDLQTFTAQVKQAQRLLQQDDLQQIVLSRKQTASFDGDAFALYRELRVKTPSPYLYYIEFDDHTVIGASPESVVSVSDGQLYTTASTEIQKIIVKDSASNVRNGLAATLSPTLHAIDALTYLLPADAVTGLPKKQATTALQALEKSERDLFGSAIGYIGFNGQIDFALAAQTYLLQNDRAIIEVGTTITTASDATTLYEQEGANA